MAIYLPYGRMGCPSGSSDSSTNLLHIHTNEGCDELSPQRLSNNERCDRDHGRDLVKPHTKDILMTVEKIDNAVCMVQNTERKDDFTLLLLKNFYSISVAGVKNLKKTGAPERNDYLDVPIGKRRLQQEPPAG